ncbi:MAG: hypothetical protein J2P47_13750, partial [Acetobacteraceae bacterium]|nr:hypothetical protein [Acetobacteraceae bacterium]
ASDVVYQDGTSERLQVPVRPERMNAVFAPLLRRIRGSLRAAGFADGDITLERSVDMRYRYQVHELNVPLSAGDADLDERELEALYARFDALYEETYGKGSAYRAAGKEIVASRVTGSGALPKPSIAPMPRETGDAAAALKGERLVYFMEYGDHVPTALYDIGRMRAGMEIAGRAIIETPVTTIVINPNDRALMDEFGNIRITVGLSPGKSHAALR